MEDWIEKKLLKKAPIPYYSPVSIISNNNHRNMPIL